jgi:hypothetical protein
MGVGGGRYVGNGGYIFIAPDPFLGSWGLPSAKRANRLDQTLLGQGKSFYSAEVLGLELGTGPCIGVGRGM